MVRAVLYERLRSARVSPERLDVNALGNCEWHRSRGVAADLNLVHARPAPLGEVSSAEGGPVAFAAPACARELGRPDLVPVVESQCPATAVLYVHSRALVGIGMVPDMSYENLNIRLYLLLSGVPGGLPQIVRPSCRETRVHGFSRRSPVSSIHATRRPRKRASSDACAGSVARLRTSPGSVCVS